MRAIRLRPALLVALLTGCGSNAHDERSEAADASAPGSDALSLARTLARPERALADVLRGRIALAAEPSGLGVAPATAGDLALHVAAYASEPTRIGTDDEHGLAISVEGAAPSAAELDDGAALHREVFPATDAIWATTAARAELFFLLRDPRAPKTFRLHLERGAGLEAPERSLAGLTFRDARGHARLQIPTPVALDARGERRSATMTLSDDGHTLTLALDDTGLERPILLDPAVLQARWVAIGDRMARTGGTFSWDPTRQKLLAYGGYELGGGVPGAVAKTIHAYDTPSHAFALLDSNGPAGFSTALIPGGPSPSVTNGFVGAFDTVRGKLVAVGGNQYACPSTGCEIYGRATVWEWDAAAATWAQRCTDPTCAASAPSQGSQSTENVYDPTRKVNVVCDPNTRACKSWNGTAWTTLATFAGTALYSGWYDPTYGAATFPGGDGTYSWTGTAGTAGAWVKRTTSSVAALSATYDGIRKRTIALVANGSFSDTYEWDGVTSSAWTRVLTASTATPYAKPFMAMGFDPVNGRAIAWGGGLGQSSWPSTPTDMIAAVWEYQAFGNACAGDVDCLGGSCRDGFCCDAKCGACRRCDAPGAGGVCAPYAGAASVGTEHDTCTGANACDPSGACKLKSGQTCTSGVQCVSGACVDGVCCGSACTQACEACNVTPGTCTPAPKGSSGRAGCGLGACNGTSTACSTTCTTDGDCSALGYCGTTSCVATKAAGAACARDRQCQSGACRDGVCCNRACGGACEVCAAIKGATADGACTPLPSSTKPAGCGGYACSGGSGACAASCATDAACASGYYCDGALCQKTRAQGEGCARAGECATGLSCADGVCCNAACDGACQACSAAHKQSGDATGTCGAAIAGSDPGDRCPNEAPSTCGRNGVCGAGGTCALWAKGTACDGGVACDAGAAKGKTCDGLGACTTDPVGTACAPGLCSAATGCTFTCATDADCDANGYCDGGSCKARAANGRTCTASPQCASGVCADGVCCATACAGLCEACNGVGTEGTCTAIAGAPRAGHGACPGKSTDDACTAAACDGDARDACKAFAGPEASCRAPSCADAIESLSTRCDGSGACPTASTRACAPFGCAGTRCGESCAADGDCAKGNRCDGGKCVSIGTCDGDHTVVGANGAKTDCAPYRCGADGCRSGCAISDDCAAPAICDGQKCVRPPPEPVDSGGCSAAAGGSGGSGAGAGSLGMLMLVAALGLRRGVARKGAR
jgi:hypothetical protein